MACSIGSVTTQIEVGRSMVENSTVPEALITDPSWCTGDGVKLTPPVRSTWSMPPEVGNSISRGNAPALTPAKGTLDGLQTRTALPPLRGAKWPPDSSPLHWPKNNRCLPSADQTGRDVAR